MGRKAQGNGPRRIVGRSARRCTGQGRGARRLLARGSNPIEARRAASAARQSTTSFGTFADGLVDHLSHGFRNEEHRRQWAQTLKTYAAPLRDMPIETVQTADVLKVLTPIWQSKHVTASRLRGRIERVLDAATAKGLRTGENPARWRGHLDHLLSTRQKGAQRHHAAMPYTDVPAFLAELCSREGVAALALEFCILNASRSGEVLGATWPEIDRKAKVWTIPAARMKGGMSIGCHCLPEPWKFSTTAEIIRTGDHLFPGRKAGRPLSHMALDTTLKRLKVEGVTVHGFRSSFRDWAGECTAFPREVAEAALAHLVGDQTERAYRRGDALEKRLKLMDAWAGFLAALKAGGQVVPLNARSAG